MTAPVAFYADFQGLASLRHDAKMQDPAALKEAAKQFESLFTQMLLKSMREANRSFGDSMLGGEQGEMYQGMFDDQMAMQLAQGRGLGLAEMLIRQLAGGASTPGSGAAAAPGVSAPASAPASAPVRAEQGAAAGQVTSKADFIRTYLPYARAAAQKLGVDPSALLAQAALETGWGRSMPCKTNGDCSFNLFGVKAGGQWSGAVAHQSTLEFESGLPVRKVERFRAYDSPADSFMDYARLISGSPRYEGALGAGADVASFAAALQEGGYATDPNYAQKLASVARDVRATIDAGGFKNTAGLPLADHAGVRS